MTNQQNGRLMMMMGLKEFLTSYGTITNGLPNFAANSTVISTVIPQIQLITEQQNTNTTGVTENKNQLKAKLSILIEDNSSKLGAYAKFNNNTILAREIRFSKGKLENASDSKVRDYAQIVYNKAQPLVASLGPYGITAATQTAFAAAITAFNAVLGKPKAVKSEGTIVTNQLKGLFKTANAALANMDVAVEIIKLTQPGFYAGYKNARKIVDMGTGRLAMKGLVSDALSGEPLKGAKLEFSLEGNALFAKSAKAATERVIKKTAAKGGFRIKSMPEGVYNVTVKKVGYADYVTTVAVSNGEMTQVKIQINRN